MASAATWPQVLTVFGFASLRVLPITIILAALLNLPFRSIFLPVAWVCLSLVTFHAVQVPDEIGPAAVVFEFIIGVALIWPWLLLMAALRVGGEALGQNWGFGFGATVSQATGVASSPMSDVAGLIAIAVFLANGGVAAVGAVIAESHRAVGPSVLSLSYGPFLGVLAVSGKSIYWLALRFVGPYLIVGIAVQVFFGLLQKSAPALNPWGLGFVALILFGYLNLSTILGLWFRLSSDFAAEIVRGSVLEVVVP